MSIRLIRNLSVPLSLLHLIKIISYKSLGVCYDESMFSKILFCALSETKGMDIKMNLQGTWRFCLDEQNVGVDEKWYCRRLPDRIQVSGILQAQ